MCFLHLCLWRGEHNSISLKLGEMQTHVLCVCLQVIRFFFEAGTIHILIIASS